MTLEPWEQANLKARLPERAEQCAEARKIAEHFYIQGRRHKNMRKAKEDMTTALITFWRAQRFNRVTLRVLRELEGRVR